MNTLMNSSGPCSILVLIKADGIVLCFEQSNQPHTFVVVTLDPPIRKGQTLYPHIVLQV